MEKTISRVTRQKMYAYYKVVRYSYGNDHDGTPITPRWSFVYYARDELWTNISAGDSDSDVSGTDLWTSRIQGPDVWAQRATNITTTISRTTTISKSKRTSHSTKYRYETSVNYNTSYSTNASTSHNTTQNTSYETSWYE